MKSRIGEIINILNRAKARGAVLKGNSVLEKELKSIIEAPAVDLPAEIVPGIYNQDGSEQTPPTSYGNQ